MRKKFQTAIMEESIHDHRESSNSRSRSSSRSSSNSPVRDRQARPTRRAPRGRGRRGRGGGRGDGRGTGNVGPPVNRADQALIHINGRQDHIDDTIDALTPERAKEILKSVAAREPALMLDLLEPAQPQQGYHPPEGSVVPDWCICGRCRQMPTDEEKLCCGYPPERCLSVYPDFQVVCLDEVVLEVANRYRMDFLAAAQGNFEDRNRHAAYRQFILWQHGRLGAGHRRVIPSCCVWAIRDKYPDLHGLYTGFLAGRLG